MRGFAMGKYREVSGVNLGRDPHNAAKNHLQQPRNGGIIRPHPAARRGFFQPCFFTAFTVDEKIIGARLYSKVMRDMPLCRQCGAA